MFASFRSNRTALVLTVAAVATIGSGVIVAQSPESGKVVAQKIDTTIPLKMQYLVYLPENYESQETWPLVLFLHGAGERGDDIDMVKVHGPPKLAAEKKFPFVVVAPQCPAGTWWNSVTLSGLLDQMESKYKIDKDRIYVTGLSMGGFGTWGLAAHSPDRFAAIAPICGGGDPFLISYQAKSLPIWAFHGDADSVVDVKKTTAIIDALKKQGGNPKVTIYPGVGHDSWTQTYDNPDFYKWLLSHKRGDAANADKSE